MGSTTLHFVCGCRKGPSNDMFVFTLVLNIEINTCTPYETRV